MRIASQTLREGKLPGPSTKADRPGLFLMTNSFETGGSERQFSALARSLADTPFRPHIGCIAKRGGFLAGFDDVSEFPVGGNLYGSDSMRARWRLARHLRTSRVAVAQSFDFYTNLLMIPAARLARVPVVIGSQRQLGDLLSPAKFRAQMAMLRWCDRVVCNSRAAADGLLKHGFPENRIVVIGNGLAPSAFTPANPALPRSDGLLRVGMIARMNTRSKNHLDFLRAAAALACKVPGVEFVLVGDGPLRAELERVAFELGIGSQVRFLGDRRDITAILASLDVSVLPSSSESLSNSILESMAAGVPVVATRVGGNPELVTDERGILVPLSDVEALAGGIERLLRNPTRRAELSENARRFAESTFTIGAVRKSHLDLYAELLEEKTHRRNFRGNLLTSKILGRPLRVAIVAASSRYVGGQSVQAQLLLASWRNDPDVEAVAIPVDPTLPRALRWVESIPLFRTIVREPFYLAALWRGFRGVDVAHIFSASYWSFLLAPAPACLLARAMGKKAIIHYHSGEARDHLRRFRTAKSVLARADCLIVPNRYLVGVFSEFGISAQAIPNIVDLSQFVFRERSPLRPRLICTRGFHPYYSVETVVCAFAKVQRQFPNAQLDLLGSGPEEAKIRALVSRLNLEGVKFVGVVSRLEIGNFYNAADIFVNASILDNMPVSVLEAFASGIPVVTTSPEGMDYLVQHEQTGLLSTPGDADALAWNVVRVLRDPALALRLALNAKQQAEQYCWASVRDQWIETYQSVVENSREANHSLVNVA
jgi:glycosyltransferase involved in cell wall biosynthesis